MAKLNGFSILIVDDDPDLREILAEDLAMSGARAESAENGCLALAMLREKKFDVVISDMRMPMGDGRFLAREILNLEGPKPLFFLYSGFNAIEVAEARDLNIRQVFCKPIATAKLIEAILIHLQTPAPL